LPNITDSDVIGAFLAGTSCRDLVSKLSRKTPTKASELMDVDTKFASGQEAIEAFFPEDKGKGKQKEDAPKANTQCNPLKTTRRRRSKGSAMPPRLILSLLQIAETPETPRGPNVFDKMLKESCPYHKDPVKHTLEECNMLQRYFNKPRPSADDDKNKGTGDKGGDKDEEFPEVYNYFMIYGGPMVNLSARQRKQERQEVFLVEVATSVYLNWSDKAITFDRDDHPDYVPNPGKYPLVVDPIIGNTRLSKVFMDGGNNLNIIYAETLGLLGMDKSHIRAGAAPFHSITPGKRVQPLGQIDLPVCFGTPFNFRRETSPSRWWGSEAPTMQYWGGHTTPSSWISQTTPTSNSRCRAQRESSPLAPLIATLTSVTLSAWSTPRLSSSPRPSSST
jgi:hypothetical protein